jgi:hypothetical protein
MRGSVEWIDGLAWETPTMDESNPSKWDNLEKCDNR